jgi:hypothetical protein
MLCVWELLFSNKSTLFPCQHWQKGWTPVNSLIGTVPRAHPLLMTQRMPVHALYIASQEACNSTVRSLFCLAATDVLQAVQALLLSQGVRRLSLVLYVFVAPG